MEAPPVPLWQERNNAPGEKCPCVARPNARNQQRADPTIGEERRRFRILQLVSWSFRKLDVKIYFGLVADWHRRLLDMEAFSWKVVGYRRLATLLRADLARSGAVSQQNGLCFDAPSSAH